MEDYDEVMDNLVEDQEADFEDDIITEVDQTLGEYALDEKMVEANATVEDVMEEIGE